MAVCSHKPLSGANYNIISSALEFRLLDYSTAQLKLALGVKTTRKNYLKMIGYRKIGKNTVRRTSINSEKEVQVLQTVE